MEEQPTNLWNRLIKVINNEKDPSLVNHAQILLKQYNTAGGRRMRADIENFLIRNNY